MDPGLRASVRASGGIVRAALVLAVCAFGGAARAAEAEARGPERFDRVVLDAGHGGDDHGAEGPKGLREKQLVLDVASRLAARLTERGIAVTLTRDTDRAVSLEERANAANRSRGDLFVSIHANAAPSRAARGIETFFVSLEASDEAAQRVAARENQAFGGSGSVPLAGGDPVAAILGDLTTTEHMTESNEFARLAHTELAAIDTHPSRGVKQAPFYVLMGVQMPAVLVEIGFITNPDEERALATPRRQDEIADALARAVLEFARRWEARHGVAREGAAGPRAGGS